MRHKDSQGPGQCFLELREGTFDLASICRCPPTLRFYHPCPLLPLFLDPGWEQAAGCSATPVPISPTLLTFPHRFQDPPTPRESLSPGRWPPGSAPPSQPTLEGSLCNGMGFMDLFPIPKSHLQVCTSLAGRHPAPHPRGENPEKQSGLPTGKIIFGSYVQAAMRSKLHFLLVMAGHPNL